MSDNAALWAGNIINAANFYKLSELNERAAIQQQTLDAMLSAQQRAEALQRERERLQQMLFSAAQLLKDISACPLQQWDLALAYEFVCLKAGLAKAGLVPDAFSDLSYKQLASELDAKFSQFCATVLAHGPLAPLIAQAQARLEKEERAAAEAASAEMERQRKLAEAASRREALMVELQAQHKTALIVTLVTLFCFILALPVGFYLGYKVRSRAKRECPEMVGSVSTAFYIGGGVLGLIAAGLVVMLVGSLLTQIGR